MRAIIYARYSTDLQSPTSTEDQVRDCVTLCDRNGWEVVNVYKDPAVSGSTMLRPGIQAVLSAAVDRRCDVVVAEALDRVSRDLGDTAQIYKLLTFHQVTLHTLTEGIVTPLHVGFKGVMNAQFIADLAIKIRRGQRGVVAKGLSAGGLSYGYEVVRALDAAGELIRGERRIREDQAQVIRGIFAEYIAGVSPARIVKGLNADRIPTATGSTWGVNGVIGHRGRANGILHNELYIGRLIYNRVRMVKNPDTGKRIIRINARTEWVTKDVPALRIIDDETWNAVQAIRCDRSDSHPLTHLQRPRHLLSGIVRCGKCGGRYVGHGGGLMRCSNNHHKQTCSNGRKIRRAHLEARTMDELRTFLADPAMVSIFIRRYSETRARLARDEDGNQKQAAKELREIGDKIQRLMTSIEDGNAGGQAITRRIAELEGRQAELARKIRVVHLRRAEAGNAGEVAYADILDQILQKLTSDPQTQATATATLRAVFERIDLMPAADGRFQVKTSLSTWGLAAMAVPGALENTPGTAMGRLMVAEERVQQSPPAVILEYAA